MKRTRAKSSTEATMPPTQSFYEGGKFVFRSGIVATEEPWIILHVHKTTGEKSLPQGLCQWVATPGADSDSVPVLESFETTAQRIVDTQLNYKARLEPHNPIGSLQPYSMKSGVRPTMKAPFLLQTRTTRDGTIEITAWFQVFFDSDEHGPKRITAFGRGAEWFIQLDEIGTALIDLSAGDKTVLDKALTTKKFWAPDESGDDWESD
jgi:hypothetical protein